METSSNASRISARILVAEDSPTQAAQLRHLLETQGYEVAVATNGRLALEAASEFGPTLIISDVNMPEMDGYELSRRIKSDSRFENMPVILVTTMADPEDVIRGLECGADNFVLKPYDEQYLLGRIQYALLNRELHRTHEGGMGVEIYFNGQRHFITADRLQILNLLLSTYDAASQRNTELRRSQDELQSANARLEDATRALRESERHLQSAVDANALIMRHSLDVICTIDGAGRFVFVSDASTVVWGYSPDELVGRLYMDLVHPDDHAKTEAAAGAIVGGEPVRDFSNRYRRKDGSVVPILWTATWSPEAQLMFCVARDISEREAADALLHTSQERFRRANEQLEIASRHKDEFLANMSHELRTPLNAILGLSEALLEQLAGPLTPRQEKSVTTIASSGTHLLSLINDILDLSKVEAGKLDLFVEPIVVHTFCQSCLAFIRSQAMEKAINVTFEDADAPTEVHADPKRLKQIVVNLLTNAVKFTEQGGHVSLTVRSSPDINGVCFSIRDTGIGIAPADQSKLFQSFSQIDSGLSRAQDGTGLGLALVARLTELHGGNVSVISAPGEGSEFTVTLPLLRTAATVTAPPDRRHFRTALIIEDDPLAGQQLVRYLGELDIDSRLHTSGDLALEAAQRERPDIVLLDLQLPGESGWTVLARLKAHPDTQHIPVVVVSVMDERTRSLALGAAAHFTKPVTRTQLATFFQRAIAPPGGATRDTPPPSDPRNPVVLLAEDNAANRLTIGGYLEDRGFVVHYAANGVEAVTRARLQRPEVILMDIQMPIMDGLSAMQEIRKDDTVRHVPIVALTALAMTGDRERCLAAGANEYLTKPVSLRALATLVTQLATQPRGGPA